eukprot:NODE_48_length_31852_cov_1.054168.p13 type:complete len:308 gc:universal NODE_48_length_31852_cov_1.054168:21438-20515(-)
MKAMSIINVVLGTVAIIIWMLTIMGGVNLPGIRNWYFVKLCRSFESTMMDPLTMWSNSNLFNVNPLDSVQSLEVPPNQITFSLRNWCMFAYKFGRDSSFYRLWDSQNIPAYEIDERDSVYETNQIVQCVHPKIALKSQKTLVSVGQIIDTTLTTNMFNSAMFDKSGSFFIAIESMYYWIFFTTVFATVLFALGIFNNAKIINFAATVLATLASIAAIIVLIMWAFVIVRLQSYVDTSPNIWDDVKVTTGASLWLSFVGLLCILSLSCSGCVNTIIPSLRNRRRISTASSISSVSQTSGFTKKSIQKV